MGHLEDSRSTEVRGYVKDFRLTELYLACISLNKSMPWSIMHTLSLCQIVNTGEDRGHLEATGDTTLARGVDQG
jgi:hypothetical protein